MGDRAAHVTCADHSSGDIANVDCFLTSLRGTGHNNPFNRPSGTGAAGTILGVMGIGGAGAKYLPPIGGVGNCYNACLKVGLSVQHSTALCRKYVYTTPGHLHVGTSVFRHALGWGCGYGWCWGWGFGCRKGWCNLGWCGQRGCWVMSCSGYGCARRESGRGW